MVLFTLVQFTVSGGGAATKSSDNSTPVGIKARRSRFGSKESWESGAKKTIEEQTSGWFPTTEQEPRKKKKSENREWLEKRA